MDHAELEQAIAAHAVGALDPSEQGVVERALLEHVPGCESCRALWSELRDAAGDLALAAAPRAVPGAVEDRILGRIRVEAAPTERARPASRSRVLSRIATVAAAAVLAGLGAWNVQLSSRVSDTRSRAASVASALALVGAPDAHAVRLSGGAGQSLVFVHRPGEAVLVGHRIASPPSDRVLQLWLMRGTTPTSIAVFRPSDGLVVVPLDADPRGYDAVAVTIERGPNGSARPTTAPIFMGSLFA